MDPRRFWSEVEAAKAASGADSLRQATLLEERLQQLPLPDIIGFQQRLEELHAQSYRTDLWGAAIVIDGNCSEDCFFAFRGWLIGRGRRVYEAALAHPDSLADCAELSDQPPSCDPLWGVAMAAYAARTGEELPGLAGWPERPLDPWWPRERWEAELRRRYPRLWARCRGG